MNDEGLNWRNSEGGGRSLIWRFSGRTAAGHEKSDPNCQVAGGVTDSNMTQVRFYSYFNLQIKLKLQHSVQIGSADVSVELAVSILRIVQDLQERTEDGAASSSETPVTTNLHGVISQKTWILIKNRSDKAVPTLKYGSDMKTYRRVQTDLHSFLNSALDGDSHYLASRLSRLAQK